jgi:large subunit ribosomal protein L10
MNESIRQQKVDQVSELVTIINESKSMIVADYLGLTVDQMTQLRRKLYDANCDIQVIKNNITRRAVQEVGYQDLDSALTGPNAVAFSKDDAISAAKILYDFSKTADALELKAGVIDGKVVMLDELIQYAQLPSRETLLTQLAAGLLGTIRNLAVALQLFSELGDAPAPAAPAAPAPTPEPVVEADPVAEEPAVEAAASDEEVQPEPTQEETAGEASPDEEKKEE